jgi:hypothetical protein
LPVKIDPITANAIGIIFLWDIFSERESMGEYYATVRLTDSSAAVRLGQENFIVSPREGIGAGGGCPLAYVVTALGS